VASGIRNANAKATSDSLSSILIPVPLSPDFELKSLLATQVWARDEPPTFVNTLASERLRQYWNYLLSSK
jgi:hypothetical protein